MSIVQKFCLIFFCVFYKNNQFFLCKTNYETMKTVQIKLTHTEYQRRETVRFGLMGFGSLLL